MSFELHEAIRQGDISMVKDLLAAGVDVNQMDDAENTPLHWAALKNQPEIAELLLDGGARVNVRQSDGYEPIHRAVTFGSVSVLSLLISRGADVDARGFADWTPLHQAFGSPRESEVLRMLVTAGANVNARDHLGRTPIDMGLQHSKDKLNRDYLREHGAKTGDSFSTPSRAVLHTHRKRGDRIDPTILVLAAADGETETAALLIEWGADVNTMMDDDHTALLVSTLKCNTSPCSCFSCLALT